MKCTICKKELTDKDVVFIKDGELIHRNCLEYKWRKLRNTKLKEKFPLLPQEIREKVETTLSISEYVITQLKTLQGGVVGIQYFQRKPTITLGSLFFGPQKMVIPSVDEITAFVTDKYDREKYMWTTGSTFKRNKTLEFIPWFNRNYCSRRPIEYNEIVYFNKSTVLTAIRTVGYCHHQHKKEILEATNAMP